MHNILKQMYADGAFGVYCKFPVIMGCDEYAEKISSINYPKQSWGNVCILSSDFSDAYTKASLNDLQQSIGKIGNIIKWDISKISLSQKLAGLVFENCYFITPSGVMRQSSGFPMGGHSSREGLDNILLSREIDICTNLDKSLLSYLRLVDDVSVITIGGFSKVRAIINKMSNHYPKTMPLNIQISMCFSRYLDIRLSKELQLCKTNTLTITLAYKELATFNMVPFTSNISPRYKGSIVPNYLHRIYGRCTSIKSRAHHMSFMLRILKHREQDMQIVLKKFKEFHTRRLRNIIKPRDKNLYTKSAFIHFDNASNSHKLAKLSILSAYKAAKKELPSILYRSLPKIITMLSTKRSVIGKVRNVL
jgi:hypothetical protein